MSMAPSEENDLALARSAAAGKRRAKREVVERLLSRVRTMVGYIVGNDRDADDMVQSSMLEILRGLPGYKATGKLESWADRITVRTCMRLLHKRNRKREVSFLDESEGVESKKLFRVAKSERAAGEGGVEWDVARREVRRRLAVLLQKLPPRRRTVVALRWVFDYRPLEIAEITETSVNTVRDHLQKGKRCFRELVLQDEIVGQWVEMLMEMPR
jgi:RNA polymerase sigma-70 factor (ECF subfamily)